MSSANGASTGAIPPTGGGTGARERPADLRSAELVSRLLAATPPYLYNMPMVPHSYFFSEMLRSFVHAKNNNENSRLAAQAQNQPHTHRRSRKRSWNQSKVSPPPEGATSKSDWQQKQSDPWNLRNAPIQEERQHLYDDKYSESGLMNNNKSHHSFEKPLELTINKNIIPKHFKITESSSETEEKHRESPSPDVELQLKVTKSPKALDVIDNLKDEKNNTELLTSAVPGPPGLALPPPPPPLWYPSLYPPPYGIDPLNFFIDLRVSGHIYDRKHGSKDQQILNHPGLNHRGPELPINPHIGPLSFDNANTSAFKDSVKSNRHVSAFSVPKPRDAAGNGKHFPINLCHGGNGKFNMKYFDDIDANAQIGEKNLTSTHYVMHNLKRIYGDMTNHPPEDDSKMKGERCEQETAEDLDGANDSDGSTESKKKRCKDLRALIGLELVVDYVKSGVPRVTSAESERSSSDVEILGEHASD